MLHCRDVEEDRLDNLTIFSIRFSEFMHTVDNFGTVVGENPTPYGILALWAVNGLSIVYWAVNLRENDRIILHFLVAMEIFSYFLNQIMTNLVVSHNYDILYVDTL